MLTMTVSPIGRCVIGMVGHCAAQPQRDGGTALEAGRVDDVDSNDNRRRGRSQSGDDGI